VLGSFESRRWVEQIDILCELFCENNNNKKEREWVSIQIWAFKKESMSIESPSILERDDADTRKPDGARRGRKFDFPRKRENKKFLSPSFFGSLSLFSSSTQSRVGPSRANKGERKTNVAL
jgi:hypothetical protein